MLDKLIEELELMSKCWASNIFYGIGTVEDCVDDIYRLIKRTKQEMNEKPSTADRNA